MVRFVLLAPLEPQQRSHAIVSVASTKCLPILDKGVLANADIYGKPNDVTCIPNSVRMYTSELRFAAVALAAATVVKRRVLLLVLLNEVAFMQCVDLQANMTNHILHGAAS